MSEKALTASIFQSKSSITWNPDRLTYSALTLSPVFEHSVSLGVYALVIIMVKMFVRIVTRMARMIINMFSMVRMVISIIMIVAERVKMMTNMVVMVVRSQKGQEAIRRVIKKIR